MTVGFDVSHGLNRKSFGAFVATMDLNVKGAKFYSNVVFHQTGEEISNKIGKHMHAALQMYR